MSLYLPKYELFIYFIVYMIFLFYGIYQVYSYNTVITQNGIYQEYTKGWSFLNRKRDALDMEWETWKTFCIVNFKWFILHIFCSELCRIFKSKYLVNVHTIIGCCFISINYSMSIFTIILFKNLLFYYLMKKYKRNSVIWIYGIFWMIIINLLKTEFVQNYVLFNSMGLNPPQIYEIIIIFAWNLLKALTFSLDSIRQHQSLLLLDENKYHKPKFMNIECYLGYAFYFPNILLGPFWIYERYRKMLELNETFKFDWNDLKFRLQMFLKNMIRILFWLFLMDFALHFLYINHLIFNIEIAELLNSWSLYAFGYLMGQFFYTKYVVSYGFAILMGRIDRIDTPDLPKCIGRIHQYSDMWKYFDQGLYEFLFIYIYTKCCKKNSTKLIKCFASFITFTFIYFWHGFYKYVLIWAILNFIWLQLEGYATVLFRKLHNSGILNDYLSEMNQLRIVGIFGGQLFIPAAMSSFYFIGGTEIGNIFMKRTYITLDLISYIILSGCCYCIYHTSELIKRWQIENKKINNKCLVAEQ